MFLLDSTKWKPELAQGQERLVVDIWFECVSGDASPHYRPPLYSTLQLLKNLRSILEDVQSGVLESHNVAQAAEEILDRFHEQNWLSLAFVTDVQIIKEQLVRIRDAYADVQVAAEFSGLLRPFLATVGASDEIQKQLSYLAALAANGKTGFAVVERAVWEVTNDLRHRGHSRSYLHEWMLEHVINEESTRPYLVRIQDLSYLRYPAPRSYHVLQPTFAPQRVPNSEHIAFVKYPPGNFQSAIAQRAIPTTGTMFASVKIAHSADWIAATELARQLIRRYFGSMQLDGLSFNRELPNHALVEDEVAHQMHVFSPDHPPANRTLRNVNRFYNTPPFQRNNSTFTALDRILYWMERARDGVDETRLIALWTAMEFLFSRSGKSAVSAMAEMLPAYICPSLPRLLGIDFWDLMLLSKVQISDEVWRELDVDGRNKCDLHSLFCMCIEDETKNRIHPLFKDFSIIIRKWRRVRRMKPGLVVNAKASTHTAIFEDAERLERNILFDLRSCYRARNRIIHDAATDVAHLDRLSYRLNWFLCSTVDTLLYQFRYNSTVSLADLHQINLTSYRDWKRRIDDTTIIIPTKEIVDPPVHLLRRG